VDIDLPVSFSEDQALLTTDIPQEQDVFVAIGADISADTYAILVDLDNASGYFKHESGNHINITSAFLLVDRDANATGSVRVGVITRIDDTDADIEFVQGITFDKSNDRFLLRDRQYSPSRIDCSTLSGTLRKTLTNFVETGVSAVNTLTAIMSPAGSATVTPGLGDLIIQYLRGAGTYNASVSVTYHTA
jgi:hypothetical protein